MAEVKDVIGIDPGVHTALAVYSRDTKQITYVETTDFWGCYNFFKVHGPLPKESVLVIIEAPVKTAMYARQEENAERGKRYGHRMMSNAASNAREAELLADGIEQLGFQVRRVRPSREKKTKEEVLRISGYKGSTNQHVRDAIMLAYKV